MAVRKALGSIGVITQCVVTELPDCHSTICVSFLHICVSVLHSSVFFYEQACLDVYLTGLLCRSIPTNPPLNAVWIWALCYISCVYKEVSQSRDLAPSQPMMGDYRV